MLKLFIEVVTIAGWMRAPRPSFSTIVAKKNDAYIGQINMLTASSFAL